MLNAFSQVNKAGYQIHVHTIGDAAAKYTLDALEQAEGGVNDNRHSLAHLQLVQKEDVSRMKKMGITAHMSQYWMVVDEDYDSFYLPYLGAKRSENTYPHKTLFEAGINVTVASDFMTSKFDLMTAIYNGITRSSIENNEQLEPLSERVSLKEMLSATTINGAYANFLENKIGSLKVGKKADIIVLSKNLFKIKKKETPNVDVEMTFLKGNAYTKRKFVKIVFRIKTLITH